MLDPKARKHNREFAGFEDVLFTLGYGEGRDLGIEYRSPDGRNETFSALAEELVRLDVDLIVTCGTRAALAVTEARPMMPVVTAAVDDPETIVRAAPASNVAAFGANWAGSERRRVEILKEMLPKLRRFAALMNLSDPSQQGEWRATEAAAHALGLEAEVLDTRAAAEIAPAFDTVLRAQAQALVIGSDAFMQANQSTVITLAAAHRLPVIYGARNFVGAGGLVSYGVSLHDLYARAGAYAGMILGGVPPRALPLGPPEKAELVLNIRAASALGLFVPEDFRARADRVIE